jgi:hypothetical protein
MEEIPNVRGLVASALGNVFDRRERARADPVDILLSQPRIEEVVSADIAPRARPWGDRRDPRQNKVQD